MRPATRSSNRLGGRLTRNRGWRRRLLLHHVPLVLASAMGLVLFIALSPSLGGISISQFVVATGYVAVVFLGLTLLMGPSTPLRLDVDGSRPDSAGGAGGWPGRILQRGGVDAIEQGDEFWSTAAAKSG